MISSRTIAVSAMAALFAAPGCVHNMKVRNLGEYQLAAHTAKRHTVRFTGPATEDGSAYRDMIRDGLDKHPSFQEVVLATDPQYEVKPDVDVHANVTVKYRGSGANFPITFPGFLVFTHAWNGYVYKADITTDLTVTPAGGQPVTRKLETTYDMRHCDFGRGFWSSSGWYLPGWGATSLLAGLFMVQYDTDATPEFSRVVHDAYGAYVANNVAAMVAEAETQPVAAVKDTPAQVAQAKEPRAAAAKTASKSAPARPATEAKPAPVSDDDAYNQRVWSEQAEQAKTN